MICLMLSACVPGGCVVDTMQKDLAALAPALNQTNQSLQTTNAHLDRIREELQATNQSLQGVLTHLQSVAASSANLSHLDPMMATMRSLDESLAALRKIIENVDSAIPLFNFTKGTPPPPPAPAPESPEAAPPSQETPHTP